MASNHNQPQPGNQARAAVPNRYASVINQIVRACDIVREEAFHLLKNEISDVYEVVQSNPDRDSEAFDDLLGRARDLTEVLLTTEQQFSSVFYVEKRLKDRLDDAFEILVARVQVDIDNENMASSQTLTDDDKHMNNVSNNKQVTALVVDDNVLALSYYCKKLTDLGVITRGVENGEDAVELCHSGEKFDFIVMDYEMPLMNGNTSTQKDGRD